MKIIAVLFVVISCCYAQLGEVLEIPPMATTRLGEDGTSSITQYNTNDNQGNYDYGYNEGHNQGGTFRRERGDAFGRKVGTYGYTNNEGLIRIVNYVADENGFRAELKSTEPGVAEQEPASVIVFKEDTPTLMTYPGPEASSVPDANGNLPPAPALPPGVAEAYAARFLQNAAASTPQQQVAAAPQQKFAAAPSTQSMQYAASMPYPVFAQQKQTANVRVMSSGQHGTYSYSY
ncbi:hypothetical protein JTE90_008036 [Oedothorax gibbosus]|uniref:Cuticle protein 14 n=1 Tax=Oedothorax gibbosus TaxID=931172 RepID=A0AAV6UY84_9ARAC|nr:hypothetical protein JTE90_008036 [Oedothorax gibbosus]